MGYHAVNEGNAKNIYNQSVCSVNGQGGEIIGTLYTSECITIVGKHLGYGTMEVRFLNKSGKYSMGYMQNANNCSNLAYFGVKTSITNIGTCYRFKLRKALNVVTPAGKHYTTLSKGDSVYTQGATAGASNPANMHIVAYRKGGTLKTYDGFVTLQYPGGSMFNSNFCLYNG